MRALLAVATLVAIVAAALAGCGDKKAIGVSQTLAAYAAPQTTLAGVGRAGKIIFKDATVIIEGYSANAIAEDPLLPGETKASLFGGLTKPADQDGAVRPLVAGGYPGGPGWSLGVEVSESLLGTFEGGALRAPLLAKDSGLAGGNMAFAIRKGGKWLLAGWSDSSALANASEVYGTSTKFHWKEWQHTFQP